MNDFYLRKARPQDVRPLISMLAEAVPDCSPQTVWAVPWMWPDYQIIHTADGTPVAAGALVDVDASTSELRGLVVSRAARGQGLASLMVSHLVEQARLDGRRMVCVTKCPDFFEKLGFRHTAPRWLEQDPHRRLGLGARTPSARVAMATNSPTHL